MTESLQWGHRGRLPLEDFQLAQIGQSAIGNSGPLFAKWLCSNARQGGWWDEEDGLGRGGQFVSDRQSHSRRIRRREPWQEAGGRQHEWTGRRREAGFRRPTRGRQDGGRSARPSGHHDACSRPVYLSAVHQPAADEAEQPIQRAVELHVARTIRSDCRIARRRAETSKPRLSISLPPVTPLMPRCLRGCAAIRHRALN